MALLDNYKVITVTHHNVNVGDIGNFYIHCENEQSPYEKLKQLAPSFEYTESIYLETCNRVCYILFGDFDLNKTFLGKFFKAINPSLEDSTLDSINKYVSIYEGESAINHVYELASSMDSLVVGEREIFRQLRKAFDSCKNASLTGDYLRLLDKSTVNTAKDIYSSTKIGEKSLSIVSLAINSMLAINNSSNQRVLLVGAGETNSLVGKFLKKYNFNNTSIYNRSINNASELSKSLDAPSFHLNDLEKIKGKFDIIIICTSANKVVIDEHLYSTMLHGDTSKKLLIDLAVPRNISTEVVSSFNVDYIDINSLKNLSEENLRFRRKEVEKAKPIIKSHVRSFRNTFQQRHIEKALSRVPKAIKDVKEKAIAEVYQKRIETLDDNSKELLLEMMDYMEKKCVSIPIRAAKKELGS